MIKLVWFDQIRQSQQILETLIAQISILTPPSPSKIITYVPAPCTEMVIIMGAVSVSGVRSSSTRH